MKLSNIEKLIDSKNFEDLKIAAEFISKLGPKELKKLKFSKGGNGSDYTYNRELPEEIEGGLGDVYLSKGKYYVEVSGYRIYVDHPKRAVNRIKKGDSKMFEYEE